MKIDIKNIRKFLSATVISDGQTNINSKVLVTVTDDNTTTFEAKLSGIMFKFTTTKPTFDVGKYVLLSTDEILKKIGIFTDPIVEGNMNNVDNVLQLSDDKYTINMRIGSVSAVKPLEFLKQPNYTDTVVTSDTFITDINKMFKVLSKIKYFVLQFNQNEPLKISLKNSLYDSIDYTTSYFPEYVKDVNYQPQKLHFISDVIEDIFKTHKDSVLKEFSTDKKGILKLLFTVDNDEYLYYISATKPD